MTTDQSLTVELIRIFYGEASKLSQGVARLGKRFSVLGKREISWVLRYLVLGRREVTWLLGYPVVGEEIFFCETDHWCEVISCGKS